MATGCSRRGSGWTGRQPPEHDEHGGIGWPTGAELDALVERALAAAALPEQAGTAGQRRHPDGLSAREVEAPRLLAQGQSNAAIAEALVLITDTVGRHTVNVYAKISAANRAEAAAYAQRTGLATKT